MTRAEAIKTIKEAESCFCKHGAYKDCHSKCKFKDALSMAIASLETDEAYQLEYEQTTKNDLGVDAVSRQAVIDLMMQKWCENFSGDDAMQESIDAIRVMPSVTPQEPRKGHWDDIPKYKDIAWRCSECEHFTTMKHNYCPNCGAKMIEPQESEVEDG